MDRRNGTTPIAATADRPVLISEYRGTAFQPAAALRYRLRTLVTCLTAGLATGGLLWAGYFPAACGWLGWVALVPLLVLVRVRGPAWTIYPAAWVAGLAFCW